MIAMCNKQTSKVQKISKDQQNGAQDIVCMRIASLNLICHYRGSKWSEDCNLTSMTSCRAPASIRSVVSKVRLHANSIESTSALFPLTLVDDVVVFVCEEVLLTDDEPVSAAFRTAVMGLLPLGGVVWVSASPVEDDGSASCGEDGAEDRRGCSTSWSTGGQSVDVVDSGAVLACSDADCAELWGGDRRRLSPICDNEPRKSTPDAEGPSAGGTTLGMFPSTLLRSRSRLQLYTLDASVKQTTFNHDFAFAIFCYCRIAHHCTGIERHRPLEGRGTLNCFECVITWRKINPSLIIVLIQIKS